MSLAGAIEDGGKSMNQLAAAFESAGLAFGSTLVEMLSEHFSHRTERRGSGYTQASRYLASLVNMPQAKQKERIDQLFPGLRKKFFLSSLVPHERVGEIPEDSPLRPLLALRDSLDYEEHKILAAIIADLVFPVLDASSLENLSFWPEKLEIGSCPLAEKYFFEVNRRRVRRGGRVNVLVSDQGEPLLVEKLGLGDGHSCINICEVLLNGVRLPPGCLFGVNYEEGIELRDNAELPGAIVPISKCQGFRFLRLTILAVSPENRARAFTSHLDAHVNAGLFNPTGARIESLRAVAREQL